jgi:hypothetical protein
MILGTEINLRNARRRDLFRTSGHSRLGDTTSCQLQLIAAPLPTITLTVWLGQRGKCRGSIETVRTCLTLLGK